MKIGILLAYNDAYKTMGDIAVRNREDYCKFHSNYELYVDTTASAMKFKNANFTKPEFMRKYLDKCDWLMWSDVDSVFMNPQFNIEDLIQDKKSVFAFGLWAVGEIPHFVLHSGNYLIKNDEWAYKFFDEHDRLARYADETNEPFRDEWVLTKMYDDNNFKGGIGLVKCSKLSTAPQFADDIKGYSKYRYGDNILHYSFPLTIWGKTRAMQHFEKVTLQHYNSYIPNEKNSHYEYQLFHMENTK